MRTIQAKELSEKEFKKYGTYGSIIRAEGNHFGNFYADNIRYANSAGSAITFSALISDKPEKMIVSNVEYHDFAFEGILPIDDDVVIHVAPPSKNPVPELTEAFIVPKGTAVVLRPGVWHEAPFPKNKERAHIMVVLPERTYKNDCVCVTYSEEDSIEINA